MGEIGHNGGPSLAGGVGWRKHCWSAARERLLPTLPIEVLRLRVKRAQSRGLDYKTYAGGRAATWHDVAAVRVSANTPVEVHVTGVTAYPPSLVTVLGATASVILRAGSIVDSANVQLARTAAQVLRAIGAGAKVDCGILTPTAGDIVTNTNAARACGTGPVISSGTVWKHLFTGTTYTP